jgi:outer membrane protein OmpA-like peptidoglycan-associated protein
MTLPFSHRHRVTAILTLASATKLAPFFHDIHRENRPTKGVRTMKNLIAKSALFVAAFGMPPLSLADDTVKSTEKDTTNTASAPAKTTAAPDAFYFEEVWVATPTDPTANLRVINFKKNSAVLAASEKKKLRDAVTSLRKAGQVKEAYVASYGDEIRHGKADLSEAQQKLARLRAKNIQTYLEDALSLDVNTFNMAARPGWWARLWNTEGAEVKQDDYKSRGWVARLLRDNSTPSTASVVFTSRDEDHVAE